MTEASACSVVFSSLAGTKGGMLPGAAHRDISWPTTILHSNTLLDIVNQLLFCELALSF